MAAFFIFSFPPSSLFSSSWQKRISGSRKLDYVHLAHAVGNEQSLAHEFEQIPENRVRRREKEEAFFFFFARVVSPRGPFFSTFYCTRLCLDASRPPFPPTCYDPTPPALPPLLLRPSLIPLGWSL